MFIAKKLSPILPLYYRMCILVWHICRSPCRFCCNSKLEYRRQNDFGLLCHHRLEIGLWRMISKRSVQAPEIVCHWQCRRRTNIATQEWRQKKILITRTHSVSWLWQHCKHSTKCWLYILKEQLITYSRETLHYFNWLLIRQNTGIHYSWWLYPCHSI